ncbi:hypothetical protein Sjap_007025 [Stephania japonica]|uniref:WD repeat-containing protein 6 n=1 Tax=Stephania japonica TaxID=461633 RepID=A0AAP0K9D8_9MAGN
MISYTSKDGDNVVMVYSRAPSGVAGAPIKQVIGFERKGYKIDVSAISEGALNHLSPLPLLLAGTGSQILLYNVEAGKQLRSFNVFDGIRIHGITCVSNCCDSLMPKFEVAVFGEKKVKLFELNLRVEVGCDDAQLRICAELILVRSLPRFSHWVLDVCFLKEYYLCSGNESISHVVIGLGDNSICVWNISTSSMAVEVICPERTLLYAMRLWGENLNDLCVASGTIYNEVIVWKLVPQRHASLSVSPVEDFSSVPHSFYESPDKDYKVIYLCRLADHEGSIFRLAWSSDGSKLMSVSDDRSARIWTISKEKEYSADPLPPPDSYALILFGHNARVWDCYLSDSLIVTAGEDCTFRVWGMDGCQLMMIKEHVGRGIWRCAYDPSSLLLVTAGFDSAIKVHLLDSSLLTISNKQNVRVEEIKEKKEIFTTSAPNISDQLSFMNSKSEYVRCLRFAREDMLYVATNQGYLHLAKFSKAGNIEWTELVHTSKKVPIICMDLISVSSANRSTDVEDWIVIGDGKGNVTVVQVVDVVHAPTVKFTFTWSAGMERQLLGTNWCKSMGCRYIFSADPRGVLKLWRINDQTHQDHLLSVCDQTLKDNGASLVAQFTSCFRTRILCLDASFDDEVLVCGDHRGNLIMFTLSKDLQTGSIDPEVNISPLSYFKGAHGISSVTSISVCRSTFNQVDMCSTGGDGCICYFKYDGDSRSLEFTGMKQVKELSLIQSVSADLSSTDDLTCRKYAIGFTSTDYIIWNLLSEMKVLQISCGGWRRPHSYYLGTSPESQNCFAFVKDHLIHIHRHWIPDNDRKQLPRVLHMQYHGREIHCLCFVSDASQRYSKENNSSFGNRFSCVATGCEDGTVRLTGYAPDSVNWFASKLLGEHVGGSAVRSICFVSKVYKITTEHSVISNLGHGSDTSSNGANDQFLLLISVGAKRVLTSWLLQNRMLSNMGVANVDQEGIRKGDNSSLLRVFSSMAFQWLSTDKPSKFSSTRKSVESTKINTRCGEDTSSVGSGLSSGSSCLENNQKVSKFCTTDDKENDWRYLAVTAFLVKGANIRLTVCFIVVSCSDTTLMLRALLLPYRLWFDVALLVPQPSPVLALQHFILPNYSPCEYKYLYVVVSGSTDGSITFWDLTESIHVFMQQLSKFQPEKFIECQKRPKTGRGSQGGRWWRTLRNRTSKNDSRDTIGKTDGGEALNGNQDNSAANGVSLNIRHDHGNVEASSCAEDALLESAADGDDSSTEVREIKPLYVVSNAHQSGVNCLHISSMRDFHRSEPVLSYCVLSGGDDQALHCLTFDLVTNDFSQTERNYDLTESENRWELSPCTVYKGCRIRFLSRYAIASAHSAAVKGVWTDGTWAFTTGLDQRVRCWHFEEQSKLTEHSHLIISVPEPEALDARACSGNEYQIAVAGRGMQMITFSAPCDS